MVRSQNRYKLLVHALAMLLMVSLSAMLIGWIVKGKPLIGLTFLTSGLTGITVLAVPRWKVRSLKD